MADAKDRARDIAARLLPRQKAFADGVLMGKSYTQAYLDAYDDDPQNPMEREVAHANGSRSLGNGKIKAYIEAVTEASVDELIVTRAELLASLRDVALSGIFQGPGAGARVQAAKILLDQLTPGGETSTKKVQLTGADGAPVSVEVHKGLTPEQVLQIKQDLLGIK